MTAAAPAVDAKGLPSITPLSANPTIEEVDEWRQQISTFVSTQAHKYAYEPEGDSWTKVEALGGFMVSQLCKGSLRSQLQRMRDQLNDTKASLAAQRTRLAVLDALPAEARLPETEMEILQLEATIARLDAEIAEGRDTFQRAPGVEKYIISRVTKGLPHVAKAAINSAYTGEDPLTWVNWIAPHVRHTCPLGKSYSEHLITVIGNALSRRQTGLDPQYDNYDVRAALCARQNETTMTYILTRQNEATSVPASKRLHWAFLCPKRPPHAPRHPWVRNDRADTSAPAYDESYDDSYDNEYEDDAANEVCAPLALAPSTLELGSSTRADPRRSSFISQVFPDALGLGAGAAGAATATAAEEEDEGADPRLALNTSANAGGAAGAAGAGAEPAGRAPPAPASTGWFGLRRRRAGKKDAGEQKEGGKPPKEGGKPKAKGEAGGEEENATARLLRALQTKYLLAFFLIAGISAANFGLCYTFIDRGSSYGTEITWSAKERALVRELVFYANELMYGDGVVGGRGAALAAFAARLEELRAVEFGLRFGNASMGLPGDSTRYPARSRILYQAPCVWDSATGVSREGCTPAEISEGAYVRVRPALPPRLTVGRPFDLRGPSQYDFGVTTILQARAGRSRTEPTSPQPPLTRPRPAPPRPAPRLAPAQFFMEKCQDVYKEFRCSVEARAPPLVGLIYFRSAPRPASISLGRRLSPLQDCGRAPAGGAFSTTDVSPGAFDASRRVDPARIAARTKVLDELINSRLDSSLVSELDAFVDEALSSNAVRPFT
eukprot:tig00000055_g20104.t1